MATILSQILGASKFSISDENFGYQVWSSLSIKKVEVGLPTEVADQPLSTSDLTQDQLYTDLLAVDLTHSKVIQPVRMRVTAFCSDVSVIESIEQAFVNVASVYTIQTRGIIANGMVPINFDIDQSEEYTSTNLITLEFEQSYPPVSSSFNPSNSANESTYGVTIQNPSTATARTITGYANNLLSSSQALYNRVSQSLGF